MDPITIIVISSIAGGLVGALTAGNETKKSLRIAKGLGGGLSAAAATASFMNSINTAQTNQQASNTTSPYLSPNWRNLPTQGNLSSLPPTLQNLFNNPGGGGFGGC